MNRRHGFVQQTINLFFIVLACGLLLSVSGVSSERPTQNALNPTAQSAQSTQSTQSTQSAQNSQNTPRYSDWQKNDPTQRVGSFSLVKKPESEIIYNALSTRWSNILGETISEQSLLSFAQSGVRSKLIAADDTTPLDFRQWLLDRRQYIASQLTEGTADYLTQYGIGQAESSAGALSFVKTIDWDYQSGVGNRKWQTGLSALGALRQTDDDAIVWQLRGYAAEKSSAGVNAGLIYRRAVGETLLGVNTFLDYERHGEYNKSFLRNSFGLEFRSAHLNLYANRYWAITDPIADDGQFIYSRDGFDVEIAIKPLPEVNISGGATYSKWDGEFGDADDKGVLYNLRVRPFSDTLKNIEIETQLDVPAEGDSDWGGKISYKYQFGAPLGSRSSSTPLTFDPRAHFFDPVRREYNQRITRSINAPNNITFTLLEGSAPVTVHALQTTGNAVVHTLTAGSTTNISAPTIIIDALGDNTALSLAGATWQTTLSQKSSVNLYNYGSTINLITGTLYLKRDIGAKTPEAIAVGDVDGSSIVIVKLLGTELEVARGNGNPVIASIRLIEGTIQVFAAYEGQVTITEAYGTSATITPTLKEITFTLPDTSAPVTVYALQATGDTVVHTLSVGSTTNINAPTIIIDALGDNTALSLAGATWQATLSESSRVVLLNYGSTIRLITGTLYLKRDIGAKTPEAIAVGEDSSIVTVSLLGTELEVARGGDGDTFIASITLIEGTIEVFAANKNQVIITKAEGTSATIIIAPPTLGDKDIAFALLAGSGDISVYALQTTGDTVVHTLSVGSTTNINAATISINAGAGTKLSLTARTWQASLSESSTVVLLNYGSTISLIAGTLYLKRNVGTKTPDAIAVGDGSRIITVNLLGTELEVARGEGDAIASIRLIEGEIQIELTNTVQLQITVVAAATAHIILPNAGGITLDLTADGCGTSRQRDVAKYLNNYTGCDGDIHLGGFSSDAIIHLDTRGERLTLNVASGSLTVIGDYLSTWDNYPFNPEYTTLSIVSGSGTISYGNDTVVVNASTRLQTRTNGATVLLLLREGSITKSNGDSVICSTDIEDRLAQTEGDLTILAACGDGIGDGIVFKDNNDNIINTRNFNSRVDIPSTIVINVSGGDGNYNFDLTPAGGFVSLVNSSGTAATLALLSAREATTSFILSATPSNSFIAAVLGTGNININAEVVEELRFDSTAAKIFRTELDSNTPLLTLNLRGGLGEVTYAFITDTAPAPSGTSTIAPYALTGSNKDKVIFSLGTAEPDETTKTFTIQAIDDDSIGGSGSGTGTTATALITLTASAQHPAGESASIDLQGYTDGNTVIINHLYRGVIASVTNITNTGDFSGLANNSGYSLSISTPAFLSTSAVANIAENRAIDINISSTPTLGTTNITAILTDDHSGNGTFTLSFNLQVVTSLNIASPGGVINEISNSGSNSNSGGAVATITLAANTGLAPYTYSIVNATANQLTRAFSVDSGTVSFTPVIGLETTTAIVTARVTDQLGDSADFILTLTIFSPLAAQSSADNITAHISYTENLYTLSSNISGGKPPYTYAIDSVQSANSTLSTSNFTIDSNSALKLTSPITTESTVTVVIDVTDNLNITQSYSVIVELTDNALQFTTSAATVNIRTTDSGNIATVTATWTDPNPGAITYRLDTTNPAGVNTYFTVNSSSGALALTSSLASMQTVSVNIIAETNAIPGITEATATVEVRAIEPIAFVAANNPQAAITITTRSTQNDLFTVSADFDTIGDISYSVGTFAANFSTGGSSGSDGNIINLISGITAAGTTKLEIIATENFFSDSATLTITVSAINPPPLTLTAINTVRSALITSTAKIADLALSGGFSQGNNYSVYLHPGKVTNNVNFAIDYTVGDTTAVLNLTNTTIAEETTLTATVVLDDQHPETDPQTLAFTIALLSIFAFADNNATATYRTEFDDNIALITLGVVGNLGDVTYGYATTTTTPPRYVLHTTGIDHTQVIISLALPSGTTNDTQTTSDIVIVATDSNTDASLNSTVTTTVKISRQHPQTETGDLSLQGTAVSNTLIINNTYSGIIANISNIRNPGNFSGLSSSSNGYVLTQPAADSFIDINPASPAGVAKNGTISISINSPLTVAIYTISVELSDDHNGNGKLGIAIPLQVVNSLAIASPGGIINEINNTNTNPVATIALAANTGVAPYTYSIAEVNFTSTANSQLGNAFRINDATAGSAVSASATSVTLNFIPVNGLSENAVVTAIIRATDQLGDTADFALTLTVYAPLVAAAADTVTVEHTYIAASFYTFSNSNGKAPYTYAINTVQSAAGALNNNSFYINPNSGALILNNAVAINGNITATVLVDVSDSLADSALYSVIVILSDDTANGITFAGTGTGTGTTTLNISADGITGNIGTITADWQNTPRGAINYQLGETIPTSAAANLSINSTSGVIALISPLNTAQTINAEIIAASDTFPGILATATVEIQAFAIAFTAPATLPSAPAITAITYAVQNGLLTISATNIVGAITYSINNNSNFSIGSTDGIINLHTAINTTGEHTLEIIASENYFSGSRTLTITVTLINPPPLVLSASNVIGDFFVNSTTKIADLAFSGGFTQQGYNVSLFPASSNFTISHSAGSSTAALLLTNTALSVVSTLSVTVVLDDNHSQTAPQTLAFAVTLADVFRVDPNAQLSRVYRTEIDSNMDLLTIEFFGGAVDGNGNKNATARLQFPDARYSVEINQHVLFVKLLSAATAEETATLYINVTDTIRSTATIIIVEVSSQHPGRESMYLYSYRGELIGESMTINHLYTGLIVSITNHNQGGLSGVRTGGAFTFGFREHYYVIGGVTANYDMNSTRVEGTTENREHLLYLNTPAGEGAIGGSSRIRFRVEDHHKPSEGGFNSNAVSRVFALSVVVSLTISPPAVGNIVASTANAAVATLSVALDSNGEVSGLAPYNYQILQIDSDNSALKTELASALAVSGSNSNGKSTVTFSGVSQLPETAAATLIIRVTDALGDTADFTLTLSVTGPLALPASETVTVQRTYTDNFYTPNHDSGSAPYTYALNTVISANNALDSSNFSINTASGALALAGALTANSTATVVIDVDDSANPQASGSFSVVIKFANNGLSYGSNNAATATIRHSDNSGNIATMTANWTNSNLGASAIRYRLGSTTPANVSSNFAVNNNGALRLINALGTAQTASVEIIAYSDRFIGIEATATVEINSIISIAFVAANNPQQPTIVTTYATVANAATVSASFAVGEITYSISNTSNLFSVNSSSGVINLIGVITTTTDAVEVTIIATETIFGDTAAITVTFNAINPPALTFIASNIRSEFFVHTTIKIADLAFSGGFTQGNYTVYLYRADGEAENTNFAIETAADSNSAALNLSSISAKTTLSVTVVLDDNHPETAPITLAFTVAIADLFTFDPSALLSITHRTELDNNSGLLTLDVFGASGAVTYSFVGNATANYAITTGADDKQVIVSLQVENDEKTTTLIIQAVDSGSGATATITVEISSVDPQREEFGVARLGEAYQPGNSLIEVRVNHLYVGAVFSITIGNPGKFSGLRDSTSSYNFSAVKHSGGDLQNYEIREIVAGNKNRELGLFLNQPNAANIYALRFTASDDHSGNGDGATRLLYITIIPKLTLASTGIDTAIQSTVSAAVATLTVVPFAGNLPINYNLVNVNTDSPLKAELSAALTIIASEFNGNLETAMANRLATASFSGIDGLTENAVLTATFRASDNAHTRDTADFILTLTVIAPSGTSALQTPLTVQNTFTSDNFYTPSSDGGTIPYTYTINSASYDGNNLGDANFIINNNSGALRRTNPLPANSTAVVIDISRQRPPKARNTLI